MYLQHNGSIAAVDLVFVDWFGKTNEDLTAQQLNVIALEPGPLREIEEHIRSCDKSGGTLHVPHVLHQRACVHAGFVLVHVEQTSM